MAEQFPGENLEIAKQMLVWWNLGDRDIVEDAIDPEVEIDTPLTSTSGVPYRGLDGLRRWIAEIDEQFEEWWSLEQEWTLLDDGRVLLIGELHMRGRGSGVELDLPLGWLFSFNEGRLTRYEVFADLAEARRAAGLSGTRASQGS